MSLLAEVVGHGRYYGDRLSAPHELLAGGRIDVLTGDYLAEVTMLILGSTRTLAPVDEPVIPPLDRALLDGPTRDLPLGTVIGARSRDKAGSANIGLWARDERTWRWLAHILTVERLRKLLPETAPLPISRYLLPNMLAVNFVVDDLLGEGVAYQARHDPQAKAVAEVLL